MGWLTSDEVERLTGTPRKSLQVEWLRSRRIRHYVNRLGEPVVAWAWLDAEAAAVVKLPKRPNFAVLKGAA